MMGFVSGGGGGSGSTAFSLSRRLPVVLASSQGTLPDMG